MHSSLMSDDPCAQRGERPAARTSGPLDDQRVPPNYAHNRDVGYPMPISSPQQGMDVFPSEFDAAREYGALWISVWHPALSGCLARGKAVFDLRKAPLVRA
jgi:hypothetical protein